MSASCITLLSEPLAADSTSVTIVSLTTGSASAVGSGFTSGASIVISGLSASAVGAVFSATMGDGLTSELIVSAVTLSDPTPLESTVLASTAGLCSAINSSATTGCSTASSTAFNGVTVKAKLAKPSESLASRCLDLLLSIRCSLINVPLEESKSFTYSLPFNTLSTAWLRDTSLLPNTTSLSLPRPTDRLSLTVNAKSPSAAVKALRRQVSATVGCAVAAVLSILLVITSLLNLLLNFQ